MTTPPSESRSISRVELAGIVAFFGFLLVAVFTGNPWWIPIAILSYVAAAGVDDVIAARKERDRG